MMTSSKPWKLVRASAASMMLASALAGCSAFPTSGPSITSEPTIPSNPQEVLPHVLIEATDFVARVANLDIDEGSLGGLSSRSGASDIRLGIGDTVGVTIFEAAAGGLFIPNEAGARAGNFVALPDQQVDRNGTISVPYAGLIPAVGRRAPEVQAEIESRLKNRAIEPQAVVSIRTQGATQVSVLGEVNLPSRLSINPAGERILDVIARAGGPKDQGFESYVTLQRGTKKQSVYFNRLVNVASNNVFVRPGDIIYVYRQYRSFVIVGAASFNGKYNFEAEQTTVSEALGRAGGLIDQQANPTSVYIYRQESRKTAQDLGIDVAQWPEGPIPVIYHFDLRQENGLFTLRKFLVHDKDVIFAGNAITVELSKVLNFLKLGADTVEDASIARYYQRAGRAILTTN